MQHYTHKTLYIKKQSNATIGDSVKIECKVSVSHLLLGPFKIHAGLEWEGREHLLLGGWEGGDRTAGWGGGRCHKGPTDLLSRSIAHKQLVIHYAKTFETRGIHEVFFSPLVSTFLSRSRQSTYLAEFWLAVGPTLSLQLALWQTPDRKLSQSRGIYLQLAWQKENATYMVHDFLGNENVGNKTNYIR